MKKTTIYLPDDLKKKVERAARAQKKSEADVIREAIADAVQVAAAPFPRIPLVPEGLGDSSIAERDEELLEGFGE